jgi:hypothetical protein
MAYVRHTLDIRPATTVSRLLEQGKIETKSTERSAEMPDKRPSVRNEKQYEALKRKGMSKERAARIANSPGRLQPRRQEVRVGRKLEAGRNDSPEEERWAKGWQGLGSEEVVVMRSSVSGK